MGNARNCLNCLNFKVNLRKRSAACAKRHFACSFVIVNDPDSPRNKISENTPFSSFVTDDGQRWLFDTELEYWAFQCGGYDHNPTTGGE